jgi:hypothetical protein
MNRKASPTSSPSRRHVHGTSEPTRKVTIARSCADRGRDATGVRVVHDTLTSEPITSYFTPRRSDTSSLRYSDGALHARTATVIVLTPFMSPSILAVMPHRETRTATLHLGAPYSTHSPAGLHRLVPAAPRRHQNRTRPRPHKRRAVSPHCTSTPPGWPRHRWNPACQPEPNT